MSDWSIDQWIYFGEAVTFWLAACAVSSWPVSE